MRIFDKFKRKDESSLDLSNPGIRKMVDWINHPNEFNKKPDSAVVFDERDLFWPTQQNEHCYLIKYTVDGVEYIGFTGPTTWSFIGIDFSKMTIDNLYETYCGWYIAFYTFNSKEYNKEKEGENESVVLNKLVSEGYSEINKLQNLYIGTNNYYEFSAIKNGQKIKIVGIEDDLHEYSFDHLLPFYEYIGIGWNPLDK